MLTHIGVNNIRVRGAKIGYANTLSPGTNSCKNQERSHFEQRSAYQAKTLCNLYGWLEQQQGALHSFFRIQPTEQKSVWHWNKVERNYIQKSRTKIKSIPLLQPEHGFCLKNGSERDKTQDWYPNEKLVVIPVCLNGRCCSLGCAGIVLY